MLNQKLKNHKKKKKTEKIVIDNCLNSKKTIIKW